MFKLVIAHAHVQFEIQRNLLCSVQKIGLSLQLKVNSPITSLDLLKLVLLLRESAEMHRSVLCGVNLFHAHLFISMLAV